MGILQRPDVEQTVRSTPAQACSPRTAANRQMGIKTPSNSNTAVGVTGTLRAVHLDLEIRR
ncbi:hypothetical protein CFIMG_007917RA00001 [Ceratocystis fimbriata CBS 114723]|uniref:Uncharacterized protein n=1 Tax=Ceratocystis fimbriata CBS 114723 TaxID=1035309 RepID=A0A2C5XAW1_9PEZI|nr:hypothetical protein CFIMG_007917RA00001 [Ceratocystis fimbriata CBS 114723]